jgi:hypothetical protein
MEQLLNSEQLNFVGFEILMLNMSEIIFEVEIDNSIIFPRQDTCHHIRRRQAE